MIINNHSLTLAGNSLNENGVLSGWEASGLALDIHRAPTLLDIRVHRCANNYEIKNETINRMLKNTSSLH